jgi:hypothetical protein
MITLTASAKTPLHIVLFEKVAFAVRQFSFTFGVLCPNRLVADVQMIGQEKPLEDKCITGAFVDGFY